MPRKNAAARPPAARDEPAQIVFFTGVRYQRMIAPPDSTDNRPSSEGGVGKRKRKRG